jgi:transcriptional regulator with XRE-family HTH domain
MKHNNSEAVKLILALRSKGYTMQKISKEMGISEVTVYRWQSGSTCPQTSDLKVLAMMAKEAGAAFQV